MSQLLTLIVSVCTFITAPSALKVFEKTDLMDASTEYNMHRVNQFAGRLGSVEEMNKLICPQKIIIPETENELIKTIKSAHELRKTIAIKSGGHNYAGVSSCCSADCWQIHMKYFNKTDIVKDGSTDEIISVRVGAGQTLGEMYRIVNNYGVAVLGGVCPGVGAGGHYQSSSLSAWSRSLGLGLDYVEKIHMIDSTGTKHILSKNTDDQENKDLFWAILGSAPGSYGIITEYEFQPIFNSDYSFSYVYIMSLPLVKEIYSSAYDMFMAAINNAYLKNISDIGSIGLSITPFMVDPTDTTTHVGNVINVMISWSGAEHGDIFSLIPNHPQNKTFYDELMAPFDVFAPHAVRLQNSSQSISEAALAAAAAFPDRHYRYYLKTSLFDHVTFDNMTGNPNSTAFELWKKNIVDKLVDVAQIDDVNIASFLVNFAPPNGRNMDVNGATIDVQNPMNNPVSYPLRDLVLWSDTMVLFGNGQQIVNQSVVDRAYQTKEEISQLFGGNADLKSLAFPDYQDLDLNANWRQYYNGNYEMYSKLRQIKTRVDPINMFQGPMTIKPLSVEQTSDCKCCDDEEIKNKKHRFRFTKHKKQIKKHIKMNHKVY